MKFKKVKKGLVMRLEPTTPSVTDKCLDPYITEISDEMKGYGGDFNLYDFVR